MRVAIVIFLFAGCRSTEPEPVDPASLVKLSLRADRGAVAPGTRATVAAHFQLADGWHIYWQNPGEAGLPTEATLEAPEGFAVEGPRYPAPVRFVSPGNIVSYGYEHEAALLFATTAPAQLSRPARFSVAAEWLACRERCIRGKGAAELVLPLGSTAPTDDLARFAERLPRPAGELDAEVEWCSRAEVASVTVRVAGATHVEFFPAGPGVHTSAGASRLELEVRPRAEVRGVLMVTRDSAVRFYEVSWPRPS